MARIQYHRNRGVALLVFVLILAAGSAYFLIGQLSAAAIQAAREEHDARVLAQAKQALIAYAITHSDLRSSGEHGFLPCPDIDESTFVPEGGAHGTCGGKYENSLGRLPWVSLGIGPLKDSAGECLWYAVSGQYKKNGGPLTNTEMLNADTNGTFEIYDSEGSSLVAGQVPDNRPVAVIFAPGESIKAQDRANLASGTEICGGNYGPENYLDSHVTAGIDNHSLSGVADDTDAFIIGTTNRDPDDYANQYVNDRLIYITKADIWEAILARKEFSGDPADEVHNDFYKLTADDSYTNKDIENLTKWVAGCLAKYGNDTSGGPISQYSLPFPAPMDHADYRPDNVYDDRGLLGGDYLAGRLPDNIGDSNLITGKSGRLISDCDLTTGVPSIPPYIINPVSASENAKYRQMWQHWKDHFFYLVADLYQPGGTDWSCLLGVLCVPPVVCDSGTRCLALVDDTGAYLEDYSAMVIFSQRKLVNPNQTRLAPPVDVNDAADEKRFTLNYLERPAPAMPGDNVNAFNNYVNTPGDDTVEIYHYDPSTDFNDVFYCLNDDDSGTSTHHEIRRCPRSN